MVIDGPPVFGSIEARLLPSIADKLLFVVKWASTRREVAQNALSLLRDVDHLDMDHSNLALAILTQVDLKRHARYRYGDVGEFLVKRGNPRAAAARQNSLDKDPRPGAHDEQPCEPRAPGD